MKRNQVKIIFKIQKEKLEIWYYYNIYHFYIRNNIYMHKENLQSLFNIKKIEEWKNQKIKLHNLDSY